MNLSRGRADWVWNKIHAQEFTLEAAEKVASEFGGGGKLVLVPKVEERHTGLFNLVNSAGCFILLLQDDDAPYLNLRS